MENKTKKLEGIIEELVEFIEELNGEINERNGNEYELNILKKTYEKVVTDIYSYKEKANSNIYTMKNWEKDKSFLCNEEQEITKDVFDVFKNSVMPHRYKGKYLMAGEAYKYNNKGELVYMTFMEENEKYYYLGLYSDSVLDKIIMEEF